MLNVLLLSIIAAPAPGATALPKGQAPHFLVISVKDSNLVAKVTVYKTVPVTKQVVVNVNGKQETRTYTEYETVVMERLHQYPLKTTTATYADGRKIDDKTLVKLLAKPTLVVLSGNGQTIDAAYLKLFKKDTIVLVTKPTASTGSTTPGSTAPGGATTPGGAPAPPNAPMLPPVKN